MNNPPHTTRVAALFSTGAFAVWELPPSYELRQVTHAAAWCGADKGGALRNHLAMSCAFAMAVWIGLA